MTMKRYFVLLKARAPPSYVVLYQSHPFGGVEESYPSASDILSVFKSLLIRHYYILKNYECHRAIHEKD